MELYLCSPYVPSPSEQGYIYSSFFYLYLNDTHKFWAHYCGFIIKIILLETSYQNTQFVFNHCPEYCSCLRARGCTEGCRLFMQQTCCALMNNERNNLFEMEGITIYSLFIVLY